MSEPKQSVLNIGLREEIDFTSFYIAGNQEIVQILQNLAFSTNNLVYLYGVTGSGKSHLLVATNNFFKQQKMLTSYLPMSENLTPAVLENLEHVALLCIDDVQLLAGKRDWEEGLLYCIKNLLDSGGKLLVTSNVPPGSLEMLPDLRSRLMSGLVLQIQVLTDQQKMCALRVKAQLRGLVLSDNVLQYLLTHFDRHPCALFGMLDVLDKMALEQKCKITIPFIKKVLQCM